MKHLFWLGLSVVSLGAFAAEPVAGSADEVLIASPKGNITRADFDSEISNIPEKDRVEFLLDQKRIDKTLDSMVVNRWLATEAREIGLDKDPEIAGRIAQETERILAKSRVAKLKNDTVLQQEEVRAKEFYLASKSEYEIPLMIGASHILVGFKNRTKEEALARANEVRKLVLAEGADFAKLVEEYSDDPSKVKNKGNLGSFEQTRMVKPFWDAASALKMVGEISELAETKFGFHIIRLESRRESRQRPFEEVRASIIAKLNADLDELVVKQYANDIRANEKVKANTEAILRLNPSNDPAFPRPAKK